MVIFDNGDEQAHTSGPANSAQSANYSGTGGVISSVGRISTGPCLPPQSQAHNHLRESLLAEVQLFTIDHGVLATESELLTILDISGCSEIEKSAGAILSNIDRVKHIALAIVMHRGIVPTGWTMVSVCSNCGPVWLPTCSPVSTNSCAWCALKMAQIEFPRPRLPCKKCSQFRPDSVNPKGGLGRCVGQRDTDWLCFPNVRPSCEFWRPLPGRGP